MASFLRSALGLASIAIVSACGSDSAPATFTRVHAEVFRPSCSFSACHGGPNGTHGLKFDGTSADWQRLMEGRSADGRAWVIPGDPEGSYLVAKLRGSPGIAGNVMPPAGALEAERLQLVVDWISAGAKAD